MFDFANSLPADALPAMGHGQALLPITLSVDIMMKL